MPSDPIPRRSPPADFSSCPVSCCLGDVVKTTVFLKDMGDFAAMNKVYAEYFASDCPAHSAVEVAVLPKGSRIEIEAIAVLPNAK